MSDSMKPHHLPIRFAVARMPPQQSKRKIVFSYKNDFGLRILIKLLFIFMVIVEIVDLGGWLVHGRLLIDFRYKSIIFPKKVQKY